MMADLLTNLALGFSVVLTPGNLFLVFAGCFFGTCIGAIPGLGPVNGVAILLPLVYSLGLEPASGLMTLTGVYYGAEYGGRIASILLNIPGDAGAVMTTLDGHPLALAGQADRALALSALASFFGSLLALVLLLLASPWLIRLALAFGPAEYVVLILLAMAALVGISSQSAAKTLLGLTLGLLLATVGIDSATGVFRFSFGIANLFDGIDFLVLIIGLFAISEVLVMLDGQFNQVVAQRVRSNWQVGRDVVKLRWSILRGGVIGFGVGLLPGTGASIASTVAYAAEQRTAVDNNQFGRGDLRGLAAPEAANNGAAVGALVPMLSLGVPGSGTTAVLLGALLMYNVTPGPLLFTQHPEITWGLIASMFVGNLMLLVLNLPLVGLFAGLLRVPRWILVPVIVMLTFAGVYAIHGDNFDLMMMVGLGGLGYLLRLAQVSVVPIVLGYILGGLFETNLRRALSISDGDWSILWQGSLAWGMWIVLGLLIFATLIRMGHNTRPAA